MPGMSPPAVLCLASYFKGERFIERCKQEGCLVYLLTVEKKLGEPWPRHAHTDPVRHFLASVPGPWLVKPRSEASAAGIKKCHTADEVWRRIDELGDDQSFHLIERMVPGELFHVDSLTRDNRVIFAEV